MVSHATYIWFVTLMTGGVAGAWMIVDSVRLRRALRADPADPAFRDRIFGSVIGLLVSLVGLVGVVAYHV